MTLQIELGFVRLVDRLSAWRYGYAFLLEDHSPPDVSAQARRQLLARKSFSQLTYELDFGMVLVAVLIV
jgi:hypothetical protein